MGKIYKLSVIIPAFNEAENLKIILHSLIKLCDQKDWKIIIVNDGSNDNTKEILAAFQISDHFTLIHHKLNKGYGAAIKSGIMACDTEYLITIDADGQHHIEDIEKLYTCMKLNDADMVVGSRKGTKSSSFFKEIGKLIIRTIAKILMNVPIYDINSGMKLYNTQMAKKYIYLAPDTMSFSDIITLIFINNRHLVLEEPILITRRIKGKSSIGIATAFHTVMEIINIVILFNPMKIFLPLSIITFLVGLIKGIPIFIKGQGITTGSALAITAGIIFFLLGLIAEQLSLIRRNNK